MFTAQDAVKAMETLAPPALALAGDPIGWHAGDPARPVKRIVLALDASLPAVREAVRNGAQMLIVHHPRFYRGLSTLAQTNPAGARAAEIVRSGLAVYSAHTNLDMAEGGTNDQLAAIAGLKETAIVKPEISERLLKLAVFVPATHVEAVRREICAAGAGGIGNYSECTFRVRGTGTFRCGANAAPFQGRPGSFEEADEYRLETVFGEFARERIMAAVLRAHPYEEAAYDLYPLLGQAKQYGFGRVGCLAKAEALGDFAARMARAVGSDMAQCLGNPRARVKRVAVWAGGGVETAAIAASGAEALVAGEVGYHDAETLAEAGVAVVTLGHGPSEEPVLRPLAERLRRLIPASVKITVTAKGTTRLANV